MITIKNEIKDNFTIVPNFIIGDKNLTDGDFRLLIFLYSLPNDWDIKQEYLAKQVGCNQRNLNAKISRLKENGYLEIVRKGQTDYEYILRKSATSVNDVPEHSATSLGDVPQLYTNTIYKESNNINIITKESKRFTKPKIEDIRKYCEERNNGIDPEYFYDFYESKDWYIGKNKMKDFKSAIRTWERNRRKETSTNKPTIEQVAEGVFKF